VLSSGPDLLRRLEDAGVFLLSDAAGLLGGLTRGVSLLTLLGVLLVPLTFFVLWRTAFGLPAALGRREPVAADSLGVAVYRMKYAASSCPARSPASVAPPRHRLHLPRGQTGGRGFIGLAAVIFGNWRPGGLAAGAALFGYATRSSSVPAAPSGLLLFVALLLVVVAIRQALRRRIGLAIAALLIGAAFALWYLAVDTVPVAADRPHALRRHAAGPRRRGAAAAAARGDGIPYRRGTST
jgi:simple sugar transport system permease protein